MPLHRVASVAQSVLVAAAVTLVASAAGCKSRSDSGSATAGLVANRILSDGKNIAVLSSNAPLDGVRSRDDMAGESGNGGTVVHNLESVLASPAYGMQVYDVVDAVKADVVLERLVEAAKEVGAEGTLVWFHHGIGVGRGELLFPENYSNLHYMRIAQEIIAARRGLPMRRFVIFLDSDYSGRWVSPGEGVFSGWFPKIAEEMVVLVSSGPDFGSHSPYFSFALAEQLAAAAQTRPSPSLRTVFTAVTTAVRERVLNEKLVNQEPVFGASPAAVLDQPLLGESGPVAVGGPEVAQHEDEWVYMCRGELRFGVAADDPDPWEPYGWRWAFVGRATSVPASYLECSGWSRFTNSCSAVRNDAGADVPCDKASIGRLAFTKT